MLAKFIRQYGSLAWVSLAVGGMVIVQVLVLILFRQAGYNQFYHVVTLPGDFWAWLHQPWSLLSYWTMEPVEGFLFLLLDIMIFWSFGLILRFMVGELRFRAYLVIGGLVTPLVLLLMTAAFGFSWPAGTFGIGMMVAAILGAILGTNPTYRIRVFFTNDVPIMFVAVLLLLLMTGVVRGWNTFRGTGIIVAALLAFGAAHLIKRGHPLAYWFGLPFLGDSPVLPTGINLPNSRAKERKKPEKPKLSEEEELDLLLDKIHRKGYQKLSKKERKRLDELSSRSGRPK